MNYDESSKFIEAYIPIYERNKISESMEVIIQIPEGRNQVRKELRAPISNIDSSALIQEQNGNNQSVYRIEISLNDIEDGLYYEELSGAWERSIEELPDKLRLVYQLSRKENLTYKEISIQLNTPLDTVEKRLGRAMKIIRDNQTWNLPSKGISIYLVVSGISLFVAWLPDIIPAMISGNSLSLIEIYTTEITYVLDMGIISPIMFICLYLLKKKDGLGDVLLAIILKACEFVGIMVIMQTIFQKFAGIEIPIPALLTKVGIFVVLGSFSFYFNRKFYKKLYL